MCYYHAVKIKDQHYITLKEIEREIKALQFPYPVVSGFEYGYSPVIKPDNANCSWDIVQMEWGFLPPYLKNRESVKRFREGYKDEAGKFHPAILTLNAIGEEILQPNKMYRQAALQRRCLVVSFGFYEWRHLPQMGKKGQPLKTTIKYPYHINLKDTEHCLMAGIWQPWTDRETGETVDTFAVVTTKANSLMEQIHNSKKRMPVIFDGTLAAEWISDDISEERIQQLATFQYPAEKMQAHTIHKDFRGAAEPNEVFVYEGLPDLVV
jgi:putative SOS response-associated peptidase YedK